MVNFILEAGLRASLGVCVCDLPEGSGARGSLTPTPQ